MWIPPSLDALLADLRYGARQLLHNRMFTVVALSGLAIAIGLNAAVFSLVNAIVWRPLPVKDGDRVVRIVRMERKRDGGTFTRAELRHYNESGTLEEITGSAIDDRVSAGWPNASAPRAVTALTAPNFFSMPVDRPWRGDSSTRATVNRWRWSPKTHGRGDSTAGQTSSGPSYS